MEVKIFLIGSAVLFLVCVAIVSYEAYRGKDWKVAAMFMSIGFLIAVGQLATGIK